MKLLLVLLGLVFLVNSQSETMRRRLEKTVQEKTCGAKAWSMGGASKNTQAATGSFLVFCVPLFLCLWTFRQTKLMKEKLELDGSTTDPNFKPDEGDNFVMRSIKYRSNRVDVQWGNRWPVTAYISRSTPAVGMFLADPASPLTRADHGTLFAVLFAGNVAFYLFYYMEGKAVSAGLGTLAVFNIIATFIFTKMLLSEHDFEELDSDEKTKLCPGGTSCCVKMAACVNNSSQCWSLRSRAWCARRVCGEELTAVRMFFLFVAVGLYLAITITMFVFSSGFTHPVCFAVQESWGVIAVGNFLVAGVLISIVVYLILKRTQKEFDEEATLKLWKNKHEAHQKETKSDSVELEINEAGHGVKTPTELDVDATVFEIADEPTSPEQRKSSEAEYIL